MLFVIWLFDQIKSASNIVEEKMEVHIDDQDFNLPKPENLIRATNRLRQKYRPPLI
jgi:hypothetical protein